MPIEPDADRDQGITAQTAVSPNGDIRCYECDHEYQYLGDGPHPGGCPECGSRAVSPSGMLRFGTPMGSTPATGHTDVDELVKLIATDATDRVFIYRFALLESGARRVARLVRIEVCGRVIHPTTAGGTILLTPDPVQEALHQYDNTLEVGLLLAEEEGESNE